MSKKCCKTDPPCRDCPKRKKRKHRDCTGCGLALSQADKPAELNIVCLFPASSETTH